MKSLLKATVAVTFLAAAAVAASSYVSAPFSAGFLASPPFLWVAANVIIIWLLRGGKTDASAAASSAGGHAAADMISAVDSLYPSSEYEGVSAVGVRTDAAASKRQASREARAAARRADRPGRMRKKYPASEGAPSPRAVEEVVVTAGTLDDAGEDADVSMDSLWHSIVQRRAARPVAVRKSETWASDEVPRLERAAETAVARREMRKSASATRPPPSPPQSPRPPPAARQPGWRTREVLVAPPQDDLMRRVESLIRRHHEDLSLQRQESEQRQTMELRRGGHRANAPLIRV